MGHLLLAGSFSRSLAFPFNQNNKILETTMRQHQVEGSESSRDKEPFRRKEGSRHRFAGLEVRSCGLVHLPELACTGGHVTPGVTAFQEFREGQSAVFGWNLVTLFLNCIYYIRSAHIWNFANIWNQY